jgi:hypothetical protein
MSSIFDELDDKRLAPQNFGSAIFICVLSIFLGFVGCLKIYVSFISVVNTILAVIILMHLRRYLSNFFATQARLWLLVWMINYAVSILLPLLMIAPVYFGLIPLGEIYRHFFDVSLIIIDLVGIFAIIMSGVALIKIRDDFVGLLRPLGLVYLWLRVPLELFSAFLSDFAAGQRVFFRMEPYYGFVSTFLFSCSTMVIIAIFARARRFPKSVLASSE